jgi:peroxiredoxin
MAHGAILVLVSPQRDRYSKALKKEKKLTIDIVCDPGNRVAEAYGIKYKMSEAVIDLYKQFEIKLDEHNGDDSWTLPMPSRLIIDQDGIVRYADISPDYSTRPEPEDTLIALKKITG